MKKIVLVVLAIFLIGCSKDEVVEEVVLPVVEIPPVVPPVVPPVEIPFIPHWRYVEKWDFELWPKIQLVMAPIDTCSVTRIREFVFKNDKGEIVREGDVEIIVQHPTIVYNENIKAPYSFYYQFQNESTIGENRRAWQPQKNRINFNFNKETGILKVIDFNEDDYTKARTTTYNFQGVKGNYFQFIDYNSSNRIMTMDIIDNKILVYGYIGDDKLYY